MKRQLTDTEKQEVRKQQLELDDSLRCFISGEVIAKDDEIEYDHIQPYSKDGATDVVNVRMVLKKYNRRKSDQSLYEVRDNLRLDRLFETKQNNIKLQDIFFLKAVEKKNFHVAIQGGVLTIDDSVKKITFSLLRDKILNVDYFYGRVPIVWLENDDQEGLQPRVIDYKRLIALRDHLLNHAQLAPSISRLVGNRLKLFDGQHKLAAQVLNGVAEIDLKVYVSPEEPEAAKKLFDDLMITNLDAHSKLKQVPFYTSTLLDRLSVIYKEHWEDFVLKNDASTHTESNFIQFLVNEKNNSRADALAGSALEKYVAIASKDSSFPITIDLLNKTIFPTTLYLEPSTAKFASDEDFRTHETENFHALADLLVKHSFVFEWTQNVKGKSLTNVQLKARRIWHKGSVLTWTPYLKSILFIALDLATNRDKERMLYRGKIDDRQKEKIAVMLARLFSHTFWDEPEGEIDSLLVSARKQDDLFERKGLTERYVLLG
jgi:hypothetical protein